jgi:prepilin-type N-terminal cleavage/methylation domain-containing protein
MQGFRCIPPMKAFVPLFPRSARGFTLVELLVVLAIISVLIAIAVPVYGRMSLSARTTASMNNLRQIHSLINAYIGDNNGVFPQSVWQASWPEQTWRRKIWENANGSLGTSVTEVATAMDSTGYNDVMWCPLMVAKHGRVNYSEGQGSYALNGFFKPSNWRYPNDDRRSIKGDFIGKKEPIIMAGTVLKNSPKSGTFFHNESTAFPYDTDWANVAYEYGGGGDRGLALFFDGRVELITKQQGADLGPMMKDMTTLE